MFDSKAASLLRECISEIVHTTDGLTWKEKRDMVLEGATEEERSDLEEFAGWFEDMEDRDYDE